NPVSFFYCFDERDEKVVTIVAEVNNTPLGERHLYVLDEHNRQDDSKHIRDREFATSKAMHVSPFMSMDVGYRWRFSMQARRLFVHMETANAGARNFDASLSLARTEITGRSLARVLVTHPLMTVKVITAIYWQALRLWIKGAPVYDHDPKTKKILEN
ncbi:MAG: DUF1365 domain-containing protein, partial [Gammaproteobacteria bacterium]|nr:DUF1365 domain-containing protein [Gammaproteobacteria bacterium]